MDQSNISFIHSLVYAHDGALFDNLMVGYYKTYQSLEQYVNPIAAKCQDSKLLLSEDELDRNVRTYIPKPLWQRMSQATIKYFQHNAKRRLPIASPYDHGVIQLPGMFFNLEPYHDKAKFAKNYQFAGQLTSVHTFDVGQGEFFIPNLHARTFKYVIIKRLSIKPGLPRRWEAKFASIDPGFILNYTSTSEK